MNDKPDGLKTGHTPTESKHALYLLLLVVHYPSIKRGSIEINLRHISSQSSVLAEHDDR